MASATSPLATPVRSSGAGKRWYNTRQFRRFRKHPLSIIGFVILFVFIFLAIFAPVITAPIIAERIRGHNCARDLGLERGEAGIGQLRNPLGSTFWRALIVPPQSCMQLPRKGFAQTPTAPSADNPFGLLPGGYDIYYGIIWGTRMAFILGILIALFDFLLGLTIGGIAGFFGGRVDSFLMRIGEGVQAFPALIFAIVFVAIFGRSLMNTLIALSLVGWVSYARIIRGDILRVKQQDFVDGARALGASQWRVFFHHILPNAISSLIVVVSLDIGGIVLTSATLAFLGLGGQAGAADWGQMVEFGRQYFLGPASDPLKFWYISFFPCTAVILFTLSWNFIGSAYRESYDIQT
ncbi:MAG: ABC transporter permease [Trueperaceae bacterium]